MVIGFDPPSGTGQIGLQTSRTFCALSARLDLVLENYFYSILITIMTTGKHFGMIINETRKITSYLIMNCYLSLNSSA